MSMLDRRTKMQKVVEHKGTSVAGVVATISALVMTMLPDNVRETCIDQVLASDSPLLTGGLLVSGISLLIIGPSLANRKS